MSQTTYGYENLTITFLASLDLGPRDAQSSKAPTVKTVQFSDAKKADGELTIPRDAEIASIGWAGRACAKR